MSDPESELRVDRSPADRTAGDLIDRLADRFRDEVDRADLPLPSGMVVEVVAVAEVDQWLRSCAIRLRAGEVL